MNERIFAGKIAIIASIILVLAGVFSFIPSLSQKINNPFLIFVLIILIIPLLTALTSLFQKQTHSFIKTYLVELISLIFDLLFIPVAAVFVVFDVLKKLIAVILLGFSVVVILGLLQNVFGFQISGNLHSSDLFFYLAFVIFGLAIEIIFIFYFSERLEKIQKSLFDYLANLNIKIIEKISGINN